MLILSISILHDKCLSSTIFLTDKTVTFIITSLTNIFHIKASALKYRHIQEFTHQKQFGKLCKLHFRFIVSAACQAGQSCRGTIWYVARTSTTDQFYLGTSEMSQRLKEVDLIDVLVATSWWQIMTIRPIWDQNETSLRRRILDGLLVQIFTCIKVQAQEIFFFASMTFPASRRSFYFAHINICTSSHLIWVYSILRICTKGIR